MQPGSRLVNKATHIVKKSKPSDICVRHSSKRRGEYPLALFRLLHRNHSPRRNVLESGCPIISPRGQMENLRVVLKRCDATLFLQAIYRLCFFGRKASCLHNLAIHLQNHEEHERRWAHGTFLQVIRTHAKTRLSGASLPLTWRIWLSMNPESDATAIWLERKFDVPKSGRWASEAVFSIPVVTTRLTDPSDSPGLVVFECTPLEGVADNLERFDIIQSLISESFHQ